MVGLDRVQKIPLTLIGLGVAAAIHGWQLWAWATERKSIYPR